MNEVMNNVSWILMSFWINDDTEAVFIDAMLKHLMLLLWTQLYLAAYRCV